jgi:hypothetical protein
LDENGIKLLCYGVLKVITAPVGANPAGFFFVQLIRIN